MKANHKYRGPSNVESSHETQELNDTKIAVANISKDKENRSTMANISAKSEPAVQRKCANCEEEMSVQKKEKGSADSSSSGLQSKISATKGSGEKIEKGTKSFMANQFGVNFDSVNIHNNSRAHQMAADLNAKAFTVGDDIYFGEGEYSPQTQKGKHLLAHELTHSIQQKGKPDLLMKKAKKKGKAKEDSKSCRSAFPYSGTFFNQLEVPFFSTKDCPNIKVVITHLAPIHGHQSCSAFNFSIDGVKRTKRTITTGDKWKTTELVFKMNNATKHNLIFNIHPDCKGLSVSVKGELYRY